MEPKKFDSSATLSQTADDLHAPYSEQQNYFAVAQHIISMEPNFNSVALLF